MANEYQIAHISTEVVRDGPATAPAQIAQVAAEVVRDGPATAPAQIAQVAAEVVHGGLPTNEVQIAFIAIEVVRSIADAALRRRPLIIANVGASTVFVPEVVLQPPALTPLEAIFANGEIGDIWRFDQANTDAAGNASNPFSIARGIINRRALVQETAGARPKIRLSSSVETAYFDGGDLLTHNFGSDISQPGTIIIALNNNDTTTHAIFSGSADSKRWQMGNDSGGMVEASAATSASGITLDAANEPPGRAVFTFIFNGASSIIRKDRGQRIIGNAGTLPTDQLTIGGAYPGSGFQMVGEVFGVLFVDRVLTNAEILTVENYFYEEMALLRDGLGSVVAPLPDVALAFWKLFPNSYSGPCLNIQRMSDNATQDIGFDANGVVDTAAIAAFCGASDGRLVSWYNQMDGSVGLNAPSAGTRPRIYVGSTGLMEVDGNGVFSLNKGQPVDNRPQLISAQGSSSHFTLMTSFESSDTSYCVVGQNGSSSHYIGLATTGSGTTSTANSGTVMAPQYYKNGAPIVVGTRGDLATAFTTGTPNRFAAKCPYYAPSSDTTLGWYNSASTTLRMSAGFFGGYVLQYSADLTDTEIANIDAYLAGNL